MVVHEREKGCASTRMDGIDKHNDVLRLARGSAVLGIGWASGGKVQISLYRHRAVHATAIQMAATTDHVSSNSRVPTAAVSFDCAERHRMGSVARGSAVLRMG